MSEAQAQSTSSNGAAASNGATAAGPVPFQPEQFLGSSFELPAPIRGLLRQIDAEEQGLLSELGKNEMNYLARKNALIREIDSRLTLRSDTISDVARQSGLDIDKVRWNYDAKSMTLTRETPR